MPQKILKTRISQIYTNCNGMKNSYLSCLGLCVICENSNDSRHLRAINKYYYLQSDH
jgi:hypothetical protein